MQFKHPEILYALFLLLIPIFIHLFQLRRFQKVEFTNVAFLKKVTLQTRKSSQLKKWLTLLTRLLALACVIIAFAQPYFSSNIDVVNSNTETVVYIDNSFSMQAKGPRGPLLQRALQDLFEDVQVTSKLSWFTNDSERRNTSLQDFKNDVLTIEYSQNQLKPSQVLLKGNQFFSQSPDAQKRLVYISDFQIREGFPEIPKTLFLDAVQLKPVKPSNIAIDTLFIASNNAAQTQLKVVVSAIGEPQNEIPVSLYKEDKLVAKTAVEFSKDKKETVTFDIENRGGFSGKIEINEPNITFDNTLFFNINNPPKIKVLAINEANGDFLQRLFGAEEFQFVQQSFQNLDYNLLPEQNFIVLNELKEIPPSLATALQSSIKNGGSIAIIPAQDAAISSYNPLLSALNLGSIDQLIPSNKKITNIIFSHPLYKDVFEKQVANFQYPSVNAFYSISSNASAALTFEDNKPFLLQRGNSYFFTAPISDENSNFKNSPLVVPTFYNMAQLSLPLPKLYYNIGQQNTFAVPVTMAPDEILTIKDSTNSLIPLQQTKASHVNITTTDEPAKAGTYRVMKESEFLENISYNYDRSESELQYLDASEWDGTQNYDSVDDLFDTISDANSIKSVWKWFAIFALIFLIIEMLLLKFLK